MVDHKAVKVVRNMNTGDKFVIKRTGRVITVLGIESDRTTFTYEDGEVRCDDLLLFLKDNKWKPL